MPTNGFESGNPLRVAVVGCGRATETLHMPALAGLGSSVRVVSVSDPDEHRRRRVAGMFGIERTAASLEALLADHGQEVDIVAVAAPAQHHADAVVAALEAGKHVLCEKPIALTLDDADRIVAAAEAHPRQKVMLGFNLRHHRLVAKAKALIHAGRLGPVQMIRTLWTSGIRYRTDVPAWRNSRLTGGGVLSEIGVHHFDLIHYLTGRRIERVFASSTHDVGDDETAAVTLNIEGGAVASCAFSERAGDANELEIFGPEGRLAFSIYRFDSLVFSPRGQYASRASHLKKTVREIPEAYPIIRRGGDFNDTYRREWLAFLECIRQDKPVPVTVHDGRQALRVVLAAGASSNAGQPVQLENAPRSPAPVERERVTIASSDSAPREEAMDDAPALSAIIATRTDFESIRRITRHLRQQTIARQIELLIICPSASALGLDSDAVAGFHSHRVIEFGSADDLARGNGNAAGVRAARAPVIVLCEDHAFPEPDWAEALVIAHRGPYAAVGPVVTNANPSTLVSWADCVIGYGPWLEPIRACEPEHLPGHNSSYKRQLLLEYGDRLDDMMEAETVMQWDLRARGHRLYLDPTARMAHTNFALFGTWTAVQFHAGRMFGATRAMGWPIWKRAFYACASPLIPLVRFKRIWGQVRRIRGRHKLLPKILPVLAWGLTLDGIGQMFGYAAGAGRSRQKIAIYEFDRVRFITEQDRAELERSRTPAASPAPGGQPAVETVQS